MSGRHRILGRVREALEGRASVAHPGSFGEWPAGGEAEQADRAEVGGGAGVGEGAGGREGAAGAFGVAEAFAAAFEAAGGEVVRVADPNGAVIWMAELATRLANFESAGAAAIGRTVPESFRPRLDTVPPEYAPLGVSMARGAAADTGSLLLDARDGRRVQLLPPVHVVVIQAHTIHASLRDALVALRGDLPSAVGLHSGPSKSADLGQVLVRGVHGPGRVIAVVVGEP